jgi:RNA polymerase sigma-32 factor
VKGLLQGYIMRNFFPVQFCTNHGKKKLFFALRKKMATELKKTGHFAMTQSLAVELAEEHSVEVRDVFQMHNLFRKPSISTDTEVASSQDPWSSGQSPLLLMDTLVDTTNAADPVFLEDEISFHKSLVKQAMSILTEREKTIFTAQILSEKEDQRTLEDLGGQFGVSKERIRQIRIEAMRKVDLELHRMLPDPNMSDIF